MKATYECQWKEVLNTSKILSYITNYHKLPSMITTLICSSPNLSYKHLDGVPIWLTGLVLTVSWIPKDSNGWCGRCGWCAVVVDVDWISQRSYRIGLFWFAGIGPGMLGGILASIARWWGAGLAGMMGGGGGQVAEEGLRRRGDGSGMRRG